MGLLLSLALGCDKGPDAEAPGPPEGDDVQKAQNANPNVKALTVDTSRCQSEGGQTDSKDLNQDGRADMVSVFGKNGATLVCRQADFNYDGRLDAYFHYSGGKLVREQFDLDYDGFIDIGRHYEGGDLVLDEQDVNRDGVVDAWRRYDKGRLLRIETDRDGDGRADMFTYYLAGRIDRIGYDVNGDGRVDQWDHDAARRARLAEQERRAQQTEGGDSVTSDEYVDAPSDKAEPADGDDQAEKAKDAAPVKAKKPDAKSPDAKSPKAKPEGGKPESKAPAAEPQAPAEGSKAAPQKPKPQSPGGAKSG